MTRAELDVILERVFGTPELIKIWWRSRFSWCDGMSVEELWELEPAKVLDRVRTYQM